MDHLFSTEIGERRLHSNPVGTPNLAWIGWKLQKFSLQNFQLIPLSPWVPTFHTQQGGSHVSLYTRITWPTWRRPVRMSTEQETISIPHTEKWCTPRVRRDQEAAMVLIEVWSPGCGVRNGTSICTGSPVWRVQNVFGPETWLHNQGTCNRKDINSAGAASAGSDI